jgi:23S rRNA (adenine2503-C2)-methyltransferase
MSATSLRPNSPYDLTREQMAAHLAGEPSYRLAQVWRALWQQGRRPAEMTELPLELRARLEESLPPALRLLSEAHADRGQTLKWLWSLHDGARIETVLMRYDRRSRARLTVCVSSQAGCAMGCGFCATGQAGFRRNLSTGEIVEQVVRASRAALPGRLSNVVFMGMGEPLANCDRVLAAVSLLRGELGLSSRHITISTVGVVPGILRLAAEATPVELAVSLHAANDELRSQLVPLNRRYPIAALMEACRRWSASRSRRLSFEWALIAGVNDRFSDAGELASLARPLGAHVNLIPLNPTAGFGAAGTPPAGVQRFRSWLRDLGVNATVRHNRGSDIDAACGQLAARG